LLEISLGAAHQHARDSVLMRSFSLPFQWRKKVETLAAAKAQGLLVSETTKASENGHIRMEASPPRKGVGLTAQLKCICTNAHSMATNRRSWKPLCSRKTMIQWQSQKHGGMT